MVLASFAWFFTNRSCPRDHKFIPLAKSRGIPWVPGIHQLVYHPQGFELFTCQIRPPPCPNFETHVNHHNPQRQGGLQESSSQSRVGIYWPSIPFTTCETWHFCHVWGIPFRLQGTWLHITLCSGQNRLVIRSAWQNTHTYTHTYLRLYLRVIPSKLLKSNGS